MRWVPGTLLDAINGEYEPVIPSRKKSKMEYMCECGKFKLPCLILDLRNAPSIDRDWACDGCWSHWQRNADNCDVIGLKPRDINEWAARFAAILGAPSDVINKINNRRPIEPYGRLKRQ